MSRAVGPACCWWPRSGRWCATDSPCWASARRTRCDVLLYQQPAPHHRYPMLRVASTRPPQAMTARRNESRRPRKSGVGGTLVGLFVGIAVGLGLAAAVAFYLGKAGNPYQPSVNSSLREPAREPGRPAKGEASAEKPRFDFYKILPGAEEPKTATAPRPADRSAGDRATAERALTPDKGPPREETRAAAEKPIDKGVDVAASRPMETAAPPKAAEPAAPPKSTDRFWLQAGSFTNEGDAENLKAQL